MAGPPVYLRAVYILGARVCGQDLARALPVKAAIAELLDHVHNLVHRTNALSGRVALTQRNSALRHRGKVNRACERRAQLVVARVAAADRRATVIDTRSDTERT